MRARKLWVSGLAVFAAMPENVAADPVTPGPFYIRFDDSTSAADRKDLVDLVASTQKQIGGSVFLCSTAPLRPTGAQRQSLIVSELIDRGVAEARIHAGSRCRKDLRNPPTRDSAKDAVVAIIGPHGT
jgi:hypothetical protein